MSPAVHSQPEADWPPPVEILNESGASDIVLICEHASNHIPASFERLGLAPSELQRHIAWDIGAAEVARELSRQLDAICFLGTYSRLIIDLNRPLDSTTSIPVRSESTDVPGNIGIAPEDRDRRVSLIFNPFQDHVARHLDARTSQGRKTRLVAIHSFTPVFLGARRPWHAGVLFNRSREFAQNLIQGLGREAGLIVGANVPYVIDRQEDYAVPVHGEDRGLPAILIEIRQDLISPDVLEGHSLWATRLARALRS
ncbi:N-formylglutamate amidohydrolase [Mesorhizobium sp. ZMM04-5]|uniref:N-formylglutamate amidohydrolase n=1 Tax=Mesorhizobium marinum TaxID=3228790 RepID=A0ABV3R3J2_9HYPH